MKHYISEEFKERCDFKIKNIIALKQAENILSQIEEYEAELENKYLQLFVDVLKMGFLPKKQVLFEREVKTGIVFKEKLGIPWIHFTSRKSKLNKIEYGPDYIWGELNKLGVAPRNFLVIKKMYHKKPIQKQQANKYSHLDIYR